MLLEKLTKLEISLHDPLIRRDANSLALLLHPCFMEFGRSGARYTREEVIAHLTSDERQPAILAQDFSAEVLSDDLVLLTYRSARIGDDGALDLPTNRASLWQLTEGNWRMRFHQGTPTQAFERGQTAPSCKQASSGKLGARPTCPSCGNMVFNPRFPKCERCGQVLPASLAYTAEERAAIMKEEEDAARAMDHRKASAHRSGGADGGFDLAGGGGGGDCGGDGGGPKTVRQQRMSTDQNLDGCPQCADPVAVALSATPLRRVNERIAVFQCPGCGCLILDDVVGFKGAGTCFRATEKMIERYIRESASRDCGYQLSDGPAE